MRLRLRPCILLFVVLVAPAHAAPTIRIYTDLAGTQCTGTTVNGVLQGSVWANDVNGLTGAEFAVYCSQDWTKAILLQFTPEPNAALQLGNPLRCPSHNISSEFSYNEKWGCPGSEWCWDDYGVQRGGTNIAFPACQTGSRVRLFTFLLVERTPTRDIALHITDHATPSNPYFCCPLMTLCDGPVYTKLCVNEPYYRGSYAPRGEPGAIINPLDSSALQCPSVSGVPLNVHPASWSVVKGLYR
jgi:hypothetical protein